MTKTATANWILAASVAFQAAWLGIFAFLTLAALSAFNISVSERLAGISLHGIEIFGVIAVFLSRIPKCPNCGFRFFDATWEERRVVRRKFVGTYVGARNAVTGLYRRWVECPRCHREFGF